MEHFSVESCVRGYHVYNGVQLVRKSHNKMSPVQILAHVDSAVVWVENFMDGKFCDTWVNHESNEN